MKPLIPVLSAGLLGLSAIGVTTAISQDGSEQIRAILPDKASMPAPDREIGKRFRASEAKSSNQRRGPRGPRGARGPQGAPGLTGAQGPAGAPGPAGANGSAAIASYFGSLRSVSSYDATTLFCPSGRAVSGGFWSDSSATVLNGSRPSGTTGWIIEVTYIGQTSALWEARVVCMA